MKFLVCVFFSCLTGNNLYFVFFVLCTFLANYLIICARTPLSQPALSAVKKMNIVITKETHLHAVPAKEASGDIIFFCTLQ